MIHRGDRKFPIRARFGSQPFKVRLGGYQWALTAEQDFDSTASFLPRHLFLVKPQELDYFSLPLLGFLSGFLEQVALE